MALRTGPIVVRARPASSRRRGETGRRTRGSFGTPRAAGRSDRRAKRGPASSPTLARERGGQPVTGRIDIGPRLRRLALMALVAAPVGVVLAAPRSAHAEAGGLAGAVRDARTGAPVEGALVILQCSCLQGQQTAETGES